jgi:hypothetical protein
VQYEQLSFLGPFFSIPSAFGERDPGMGAKYFPGAGDDGFGVAEDGVMHGFNIGKRSVGDVKVYLLLTGKMGMGMLYNFYDGVVDRLFAIIMVIVKSGPKGKEGVLEYMASAVNLNLDRGKMRVKRDTVCTDGFMANLVGVVGKMAEPLLDVNFSKLGLISPHYFVRKNRIDLKEVTRINSDAEATDAYKEENNGNVEPANFVTDLFYSSVCVLHYGLGYMLREVKDLEKEIESKRGHVGAHEASLDPRIQVQVKRLVV